MSPETMLAILAVFAAVALVAGWVLTQALGRFAPERRRVKMELAAVSRPGPDTSAITVAKSTSTGRWQTISHLVPKSPKEMNRIQKRMTVAGFRSAHAAVVYSLSELILPAVVLATVVMLRPRTVPLWIGGGAAVLVAWMLPGLVLERLIAARKKQLRNALPDTLDLLIVCLEAGSSLDQAIVKATDELMISYPALAEEMRFVNIEMRAGKPRLEAFKNLAQRTQQEDIRALVAMLVQTDRFGTSVSQALRTFAQGLRTRRRQQAEERAAKVGVKLVFPLVFCLFPAFYVVTLGPAIIQFVRVFFGQIVPGMR